MSGAVVIVTQNKMIRRFRDVGATGPCSAQTPAQIGVRESWLFRRMTARGVFVPTEDGKYYLDEASVEDFVRRRRAKARTITAILLLVFVAVVILLALQ